MPCVGCCKGTGSCGCVTDGAPDDLCEPVQIAVTGAGTTVSPFQIAATTDLTRIFRLDGNEPWQVETVGSCDVVTPRCQFEVVPILLMVNASSVLQGYAF